MNDSPTLLVWLAEHPRFYLVPVALLIFLGIRRVNDALRRDATGAAQHDWGWGLLLLAVLTAGRWPGWLAPMQFNVDESQLLAGAHALTRDPVFWRSVDGATAGPLDFFALWPAGWLCGWMGYLPGRVTAAVLIAVGLTLVHQALALLVGRGPARAATLAFASFEALTDAPDLLHYSTELVPLALQAAAFYVAVRRWPSGRPWWCAMGGLLLGAIPLAKLQAAPLATMGGLWWLGAELVCRDDGRWRRVAWLVGGALLPAVFFATQLVVTGIWQDFVTTYWASNLHYAATAHRGIGETLRLMFEASVRWGGSLHYWLPGVAIWLLLLLAFKAEETRAGRLTLRVAATAVVVALICVLLPQRPFLHYWQLLVVPLGGLLGVLLARPLSSTSENRGRSGRWVVLACAGSLIGTLLVERAWTPNRFVAGLPTYAAHPRGMLASRLLAHARPGERLAVWGWSNEAYVETGLVQATRDAHVQFLVQAGPLQDYYRRRYLADVLRVRPALFVDSTGAGSLNYVPRECAHDRNFPELAAVIRADYTLVEQLGDARIYRRKE